MLQKDTRRYIALSTFGFYKGGILDVNLTNFKADPFKENAVVSYIAVAWTFALCYASSIHRHLFPFSVIHAAELPLEVYSKPFSNMQLRAWTRFAYRPCQNIRSNPGRKGFFARIWNRRRTIIILSRIFVSEIIRRFSSLVGDFHF